MRHGKKSKKIGYMISVVSEMYDIHPQTLRQYEREGLIVPSRSDGNTRLYTDEDLERLEMILSLTRELGVNLAGVDIILNMRDRMEQINAGMEKLFTYLAERFGEDFSNYENINNEALIRVKPSQIVKMQIEKKKSGSKSRGED
jgi:MerR family transcriptional regulator/heat shock protein HspR